MIEAPTVPNQSRSRGNLGRRAPLSILENNAAAPKNCHGLPTHPRTYRPPRFPLNWPRFAQISLVRRASSNLRSHPRSGYHDPWIALLPHRKPMQAPIPHETWGTLLARATYTLVLPRKAYFHSPNPTDGIQQSGAPIWTPNRRALDTHPHTQTNKQTSNQASKQTTKQTNKQASKQTNKQTSKKQKEDTYSTILYHTILYCTIPYHNIPYYILPTGPPIHRHSQIKTLAGLLKGPGAACHRSLPRCCALASGGPKGPLLSHT